jgi:hypothetical protein
MNVTRVVRNSFLRPENANKGYASTTTIPSCGYRLQDRKDAQIGFDELRLRTNYTDKRGT